MIKMALCVLSSAVEEASSYPSQTLTSSESMSFCITSESESSTCSDNTGTLLTFEGGGSLATCVAESHTHSSKKESQVPCVGSFIPPKKETYVTTLTCAEEARLNSSATTGGMGTEKASHILEIR